MPITYDIDTDYLYNKGIKKGMEKGMEELIVNLLQNSSMSSEEIAKVTKVPLEKVIEIKESIEG